MPMAASPSGALSYHKSFMNKSLYIIDGHAQIYAAYFAPMSGNLTAPDGEPTKATLIFTSMLLKLLRERKPDMLAVAMDFPGPTFRHEMYQQYKANRPPMPDELSRQIDRIMEIIAAMGIPILRESEYEADDLIGTLAKEACAKGYDVYICSKDKDLEQLLSDNVVMYDPKSDAVLDAAGLAQSKGITPDQVVDVLALMGDTSDNVPGVPDVGPKTAVQWIQKYGSLKELLSHKDEITGKRGQNLRANVELLELSRELVTIDCRVPVKIDWKRLDVQPFEKDRLAGLFEQLGFKRLLKQLGVPDGETAPAAAEATADGPAKAAVNVAAKANYHLVATEKAFGEFLKKLKKQNIFAIDTETTSLNPVAAELVGLSFAWQGGEGFYVPVKVPLGGECVDRQMVLDAVGGLLRDPKIKKVGQNIKYDMIVLRRAGIELAGVSFDTMVASYVLNSAQTHHSLDSMALDYLGHETIKLETLIGKGKKQVTFDMVDPHLAADYAAEDAEVTWRLYEFIDAQLKDKKLRQLFEQVEMPLVDVLADMEYHGVALDVAWLRKMSTMLAEQLEQLTTTVHKEAGYEFNVDSPKQLAEVLFDHMGIASVKQTTGRKTGAVNRSTDQEVLETLRWDHPIAEAMLQYRQLSKLKNTYVDKLPGMICADTGRVHGSFNQTVTATGRLSSSDPNLQNIPIRSELGQEIRKAFVPGAKDSVLVAADYSQIELRLLAHFSGDKELLKAFQLGQDIHQFVAAQVYGVPLDEVDGEQRSKAKAVNFGIIYGQTAYGLSRGIGVSVHEAQEFIDGYFQRYPQIKTFMADVLEQAKNDGYVQTILGRRRIIADLNSRNFNRRRLAERMAINTVVQGSAADMIKLAMINLHHRMAEEKMDMKMILQVHDELVFEMPQGRAEPYCQIIREEMAAAMQVEVPIVVDLGVGENWLQCK